MKRIKWNGAQWPTSASSARKIRTLVVDDSPFVCEGLEQLIARVPEIEVIATANDGVEAVELALLGTPDMVLIDFQMPGMDGLTAARLMRAGHESTKIVLMTAHDVEKVKATGFTNHVDAVIGKETLPYQLEQIVKRLFPNRFPNTEGSACETKNA